MIQAFVAVGIMTGLGLFFAGVLALADRLLSVEEDPRLEQVGDMLPGNNCGACGEPGCAAFAEALVEGRVGPVKCTVADAGTHEQIAAFLGVEVGEAATIIARLRCGGGLGRVKNLAAYSGMSSCRAAAIVDGGGQACSWGCLGLGDCEVVCDFDAIAMNQNALPVVDPERCTACNDCVEVCPQDLFELRPVAEKLLVQCNAPLEGAEARAVCSAACDACSRCVLDAPTGSVVMEGGLPRVNWDFETQPGPEATWRCPTGAIVWVENGQFSDEFEGSYEESWRLRA